MVITDRYDHVIDDKGRLAIPSQIRNAMDPDADGSAFYLVPEGRYLQLIPERLFERLAMQAPTGLMPGPDVARVRRYVFSMSSKLEPDKQGRVVIPDRYMADSKNPDPLARALLKHEVTLVGDGDRLELWNRDDYISHMRELMADPVAIHQAMQKMFGSPPPASAGGGLSSN